MNAYLRARAAHRERDAAIKARKRNPTAGERARRRIRIAKLIERGEKIPMRDGMTATVTVREIERVPGPFKVGKRNPLGWPVIRTATNDIVTYAGSRSTARKLAKEDTLEVTT